MGGAKRTTWIGGAVFVALVMLAASWFLAISPKLTAAADVRAQAEQVRGQNELLELQLVQLKADFEKLDEYKAELATVQGQIPPQEELAEYLRQLDTIAQAHGVTLTSITPSLPEAVVLAGATAPAATTDAGTSTEGTDSTESTAEGTDTVAAAPTGLAAPTGFTSIPVQLILVGTYDNTVAFMSDLQNATTRLFLVSSLQGTSQEDGDATAGKPATAQGDLELTVSGFLYVLPDALGAATAAVDPAAPAPTLPGAVGGKNPFVPIPGH